MKTETYEERHRSVLLSAGLVDHVVVEDNLAVPITPNQISVRTPPPPSSSPSIEKGKKDHIRARQIPTLLRRIIRILPRRALPIATRALQILPLQIRNIMHNNTQHPTGRLWVGRGRQRIRLLLRIRHSRLRGQFLLLRVGQLVPAPHRVLGSVLDGFVERQFVVVSDGPGDRARHAVGVFEPGEVVFSVVEGVGIGHEFFEGDDDAADEVVCAAPVIWIMLSVEKSKDDEAGDALVAVPELQTEILGGVDLVSSDQQELQIVPVSKAIPIVVQNPLTAVSSNTGFKSERMILLEYSGFPSFVYASTTYAMNTPQSAKTLEKRNRKLTITSPPTILRPQPRRMSNPNHKHAHGNRILLHAIAHEDLREIQRQTLWRDVLVRRRCDGGLHEAGD